MRKIFVIWALLLISFAQSFASAKDVNFIQVTDVHLTNNNAIYLKQFVRDINSDFKDIDFIVFTGDNIEKADGGELYRFLKIIKDLKPKTFVTLGDRDLFKTRKMTSSNYMYMVNKMLSPCFCPFYSTKANYSFKKGKLVFLVMNGVKEVIPTQNGHYSDEELRWLDKNLKRYKNKKVVILQHFPLLDSNSPHTCLYKKQEYLNVLDKHNNVIAVISGHYHENKEINDKNIQHIITKNFSNNTYYKQITINPETGNIYTTLIDNGSEN